MFANATSSTQTVKNMREVLSQLKETLVEEEENSESFDEEEQVKEFENIISKKIDSYVSLLEDEFFSLPFETIVDILKQRSASEPIDYHTCKIILNHVKKANFQKTLGAKELMVLPYLNIDENSVTLDDCLSLVSMCDSIPLFKAVKHLSMDTCDVDFDWEYEYTSLEKKYQSLKEAFDQLQNQALNMGSFSPKTGDSVPTKPENFESDIHQACYDGNLDSVKYLVYNNPVLLEKTDLSGFTPLLCASIIGQQEIAEFLIAKGANVNAQCRGLSYKGFTPLHFAYKNGKEKLVDILLQNGADTEICDMYGVKPEQLQSFTRPTN